MQEPDCVKQATHAYRDEQDELADFFLECCLFEANQSVKARDLYITYQLWSNLKGETTLTETAFGRKVLAHGYQRERNKSGNVYRGLGLIAGMASTLQELARQNSDSPQSTLSTLPAEHMHY